MLEPGELTSPPPSPCHVSHPTLTPTLTPTLHRCGYGFHEDGIRSAAHVVEAMGAVVPWVPRSVSPKSTLMQRIYMGLFDR